ncbi:MAG: hypothetical protein P4L65_05360 [Legionella sp.]|nr:hypothetical protein [Legionella sp.]
MPSSTKYTVSTPTPTMPEVLSEANLPNVSPSLVISEEPHESALPQVPSAGEKPLDTQPVAPFWSSPNPFDQLTSLSLYKGSVISPIPKILREKLEKYNATQLDKTLWYGALGCKIGIPTLFSIAGAFFYEDPATTSLLLAIGVFIGEWTSGQLEVMRGDHIDQAITEKKDLKDSLKNLYKRMAVSLIQQYVSPNRYAQYNSAEGKATAIKIANALITGGKISEIINALEKLKLYDLYLDNNISSISNSLKKPWPWLHSSAKNNALETQLMERKEKRSLQFRAIVTPLEDAAKIVNVLIQRGGNPIRANEGFWHNNSMFSVYLQIAQANTLGNDLSPNQPGTVIRSPSNKANGFVRGRMLLDVGPNMSLFASEFAEENQRTLKKRSERRASTPLSDAARTSIEAADHVSKPQLRVQQPLSQEQVQNRYALFTLRAVENLKHGEDTLVEIKEEEQPLNPYGDMHEVHVVDKDDNKESIEIRIVN